MIKKRNLKMTDQKEFDDFMNNKLAPWAVHIVLSVNISMIIVISVMLALL